jgi:1,4-alpha-glucan branching enzyme
MHDTLLYAAKDPVHRRYHHNLLTFRGLYAHNENFVLPLSHDEVVHGKGSLLGKMSGDDWQRFANLRLLYSFMYAQTGKKLLFMGAELGQWREWAHEESLDWHVLGEERHAGLMRLVGDLNRLYREHPAMHARDCEPGGSSWIDCNDSENSVISLARHGRRAEELVVGVFNFTPVPRHGYRIGVPAPGYYRELLNSDAPIYGGSGLGNLGGVESSPVPKHGQHQSLLLTLPPLAAVFLAPAGTP